MTLENFQNAVTRLENQIKSLDGKTRSQFEALDDKFSSQFKALDDKTSSQFKALNDKLDYQAISQRWMFGILAAIVLGQLVINYTA